MSFKNFSTSHTATADDKADGASKPAPAAVQPGTEAEKAPAVAVPPAKP